ncbi:MAG: hypothetical protein ACRYFS_16310 [Janthinobacterium lividum]
MFLSPLRTLADIADADWEQLATADADPLSVASMLGVSEEVVTQKLLEAHTRIRLRCSRNSLARLMMPLLARADFLRSNFGKRLRA